MKRVKILQFSIDFSTNFVIFSLASGGLSPRNALQIHISIDFRANFDKILNNNKIAKFPYTFSKNYSMFIDFLTFFENFRV